MAPGAGGKRKKVERSWSTDSTNDGQRPSPHRPGNLNMAQHNHGSQSPQSRGEQSDVRGRLRRQPSRGGRNNTGQRPSNDNQNSTGGRRDSAMSPPELVGRDTPDQGRTNGTTPSGAQPQASQPSLPPTASTQPSQQPPQPTPTPHSQMSPVPPAQTPSKPRAPYQYDYITNEVVQQWKSTGRQAIIESGTQARKAADLVVLTSLYQELIYCALDGRLPPQEIGATIKDIIGEDVAVEDVDMDTQDRPSSVLDDARTLFLDTLSIVTEPLGIDPKKPHDVLKSLVFSTGISPALMRHQLETPLLQLLGLVRDTYARMNIRKQTNLLYRQSNYNLLREESEGYSKLLTELFTTSNNEPPSSEVVEDTFERVKAMIGAFDMDVGRVLDVTLDVFAAVLVKQYRFFVKLLRASSWWPKEDTSQGGRSVEAGLPNWALPGSSGWVTTDEERAAAAQANSQRDREFWDRVREVGIRAFFEIGRKPVSEAELKQLLPETNLTPEEADTRKWIEETGTLPPKGSRVAAQLLGFKLRFYSSPARASSDVLPDNLIYLAALLIKVGFISLRDLYPHLWRPDDTMDTLKQEKMKEKAERDRAARPGGGVNALMMAGALSDDTLPFPRIRESEARSSTPGKDAEADKAAAAKAEENELPEPSDQKVLLLKSLLAIGAIPESLFILSKFPWLMDAYPELPEFIHRILHQCLSKVYASVRPLPPIEELREQKKIPSSDQAGVPKGHIRLTSGPPRRVLRWAQLDKEDTNDGTDYRFYWDDWADSIPLCQSVDDVFALCKSFLNLSGHKIGQDPSLLTKLARIGKDSLLKDDSSENRARWQDLCKRLLVPAISLTKANPGVVNEVFDLISFFSRDVRYNMYAEWYSGQTSRIPDISSAFDQARAETKDVLKRLSKTNIRPMARALAKIAYANPGIVINVAISQIESYENLIEVVVECARYFTYLGYDITTWALINSLGQKGRSRVQEGGLLTSRWLNALATFAGRTFKRYSVMDPSPVLQYVAEQLRQNNSTDLVILEQMISSMAGIITDTNFNDSQIQAMAGGEVLQSQTILQLLDKRHESKTTSKRLMKSLTVSKLAGQLLIAIAQERLTCIFKEAETSSELKLLGNIFDEIHRVLAQYLDLLRSNLSVEDFDSFVPDLASLIKDFGIQPEIAFWIRRPSVARKISDLDKESPDTAGAIKAKEAEDVPALKAEVEKIEEADAGEAAQTETSGDGQMDVDNEKPSNESESSQDQKASTGLDSAEHPASNPVMQDLEDQVKAALPAETWGIVGLPFYVTFWQLSVYDVHIPQKSYEEEIERLKKRVIAIGNDRSDISVAGTQRKEREKKQITQLQDRVLEENKTHLVTYGQTRSKLQKEKDRWFVGMRGKHDSLHIALLEQCFLPRLLLSPVDAFYSFKMLKFLHTAGAPNFRTVGLLDQLFREQRLTALIFLSTSREADNLGRFLNEVLRDLARWHADKNVYEKEAFGAKKDLPGFAMSVDPDGKPTNFLDYEDFRRLLYKWHRLISSALKICLNGGEYMHIRNAISVLKAIVQHFPAVNWIGRDMLTSVNNLSQNDERDDVKIPAASLIGDLNRREKKWMLPQAFMITNQPAPGKGGQPDKTTGKTTASRPQSTTPTPFNASAPEFKPSNSTDLSVVTKPEALTKQEVEDGEIEDAKMADAPKDMSNNQQPVQKAAEAESQQLGTANQAPAPESRPTSAQDEKPRDSPAIPARKAQAEGGARPSPASITRQETPKAPEPRRQSNLNKPLEAERTPVGGQMSRSQPHTPSHPYREERRLPPRPDLLDDRRERHPDYPRGGRLPADHEYGRSFDRPMGEGGSFGRLDRDYASRPPAEEPFRGPPYRDWSDRSGRLRPPDPRDIASGPRTGPQTHPDRADLIHDISDRPNEPHRREPPMRPERDERRPVPPRPVSPPRLELPNRPERFPDIRRSAGQTQPPPRAEELPTGPRSGRLPRPSIDGPDARDSKPGPDLPIGRSRQPDLMADVPSGPRSRNASGRNPRNAPPPPPPAGPASSSSTIPDRPLPTGPGRQGMRIEQPPASTASSSADKLDTSGIHPDRLKALQQSDNPSSRSGPPPIVPPSGPRGGAGPPSRPSPVSRGPPGGEFPGERGRTDKRFAGINTTLQQSGGPGPAIRGRGAPRQSGGTRPPSPQSARPQSSGAPEDGPRSGVSTPNRPDLSSGRTSGHPEEEGHARSRLSTSGRNEQIEETGSDGRRSQRYSTGGSFPQDRDREHDRERGRERREGEDDAARASSRREDGRDRNRERSRRSDAPAGPPREERYESREASRRGVGTREDNRRRRDREDGPDPAQEHEGRLRPPSSHGGQAPPPPPPPPPPGGPDDDRRFGSSGREPRDRLRDRNRDRPRERNYTREGGPGSGSGPHRKRGRPGDEGGQSDGGSRGGGRGMGNNENKRARRGA
ncbi:transcription factor/nuclear export subunit protein 2-domain-containing protein [Aspergillus pseudodeflectus]|uniref:THO complex subunit 2 n=1 Tax=Aspergillus pseudodeflectus TaxID=176178 RepID=A0ABR4KQS9_9EURO